MPLVSFSVVERLEYALTIVGEDPLRQPLLWFRDRPTLACCHVCEQPPLIEVHEILNTRALPVWVFDHVVLHELIHLIVPSRLVEGKKTAHPPEFWDLEKRFSPKRADAMDWLYMTFRDELITDEKAECIRVRRGWRKRQANLSRLELRQRVSG